MNSRKALSLSARAIPLRVFEFVLVMNVRFDIVGIQITRNPQTVTKRRWWCSGRSRHHLHRCARSDGASRRCSSSLVSMIDVCVRKGVHVGLEDRRGGRRGGNCLRNEQNATFKTPWTALSAAALRSLHAMPHG